MLSGRGGGGGDLKDCALDGFQIEWPRFKLGVIKLI